MKALLTLCAAGLLFWAMMPATAVGQAETAVHWENPGVPGDWWVSWPVSDPLARAKLFRTGTVIGDSCNQVEWEVDVYIHASVAQWVEWTLTWQGWEWYVRKPGCYAGDCIEFCVASNEDVQIDYLGFDHMIASPLNTHDTVIETYYSYGEEITDAEANGWTPAPDLAMWGTLLDESELNGESLTECNLHRGICVKLWSKICVERCNTACEYYNSGTIRLTLAQQKPWIDPLTGGWGTL
jgi:hypothetical protein